MDERPHPSLDPDTRRGEPARRALLEAGIELFGRRGLEGTTTRAIAHASGQNIAAIAYYFGSKDGLYLAVAQHLLASIFGRVLPLLERTEALLEDAQARAPLLLRALRELCSGLLLMLTREETRAISRIISREQTDPTAAFELFYERAIVRTHRCLAGLLDRYAGADCGAVESVLRAHILLGSILGFRVAAATLLRRTGWQQYGPREVALIERLACEHAEFYARALRTKARKAKAARTRPEHRKARRR
ncbi:MAG TPA: transcriptional regulator CecR [Burkholderiaceae bacterium]|nr:transcriptional regulator CecR [Burkholderiaceae bacterium]